MSSTGAGCVATGKRAQTTTLPIIDSPSRIQKLSVELLVHCGEPEVVSSTVTIDIIPGHNYIVGRAARTPSSHEKGLQPFKAFTNFDQLVTVSPGFLSIASAIVSRAHMAFYIDQRHKETDSPEVRIRDLASKHGTFINGIRCGPNSSVEPGDTVRLGETTMKHGAMHFSPSIDVKSYRLHRESAPPPVYPSSGLDYALSCPLSFTKYMESALSSHMVAQPEMSHEIPSTSRPASGLYESESYERYNPCLQSGRLYQHWQPSSVLPSSAQVGTTHSRSPPNAPPSTETHCTPSHISNSALQFPIIVGSSTQMGAGGLDSTNDHHLNSFPTNKHTLTSEQPYSGCSIFNDDNNSGDIKILSNPQEYHLLDCSADESIADEVSIHDDGSVHGGGSIRDDDRSFPYYCVSLYDDRSLPCDDDSVSDSDSSPSSGEDSYFNDNHKVSTDPISPTALMSEDEDNQSEFDDQTTPFHDDDDDIRGSEEINSFYKSIDTLAYNDSEEAKSNGQYKPRSDISLKDDGAQSMSVGNEELGIHPQVGLDPKSSLSHIGRTDSSDTSLAANIRIGSILPGGCQESSSPSSSSSSFSFPSQYSIRSISPLPVSSPSFTPPSPSRGLDQLDRSASRKRSRTMMEVEVEVEVEEIDPAAQRSDVDDKEFVAHGSRPDESEICNPIRTDQDDPVDDKLAAEPESPVPSLSSNLSTSPTLDNADASLVTLDEDNTLVSESPLTADITADPFVESIKGEPAPKRFRSSIESTDCHNMRVGWGKYIGRVAVPTLAGMVIGSLGTFLGLAALPENGELL